MSNSVLARFRRQCVAAPVQSRLACVPYGQVPNRCPRCFAGAPRQRFEDRHVPGRAGSFGIRADSSRCPIRQGWKPSLANAATRSGQTALSGTRGASAPPRGNCHRRGVTNSGARFAADAHQQHALPS